MPVPKGVSSLPVAIPRLFTHAHQTTVGTQNYTMHRNQAAFPNPEDFLPERWLDTDGESLRKASWTPFSMGSRKCIGIKFVFPLPPDFAVRVG